MYSDKWFSIVVIVACFIAGYSIISFLFRKIKSNSSDPAGQEKGSSENETEGGAYSATNQGSGEQNKHRQGEQEQRGHSGNTYGADSEEQRYAAALGLSSIFTTEEVKRAFRQLIARYHPDKVNHLGDEFKKIAEIKTGEILEAYDFFRKKYNIR